MIVRAIAALACCLTFGLAPAQAHFIWIDLAPTAGGQPQARLYFSEQPEPGEGHLIGKIAHTKAWARDAEGHSAPLAPGKPDEEHAVLPLVGNVPPATSLDAVCEYGVYEHGPGVMLHYYAKRLAGDWAKHGGKLARASRLALDIVPKLEGDALTLDVLYQGKPSANSTVTVVDPDGHEQELQAGDDGRVTTQIGQPGRYAVRAGHIEADKSGQRDGKKYAQTWHYCTLLVDVRPEAASAKPPALTATEALKLARDARAVWEDFPGFTAELTVTNGDEQTTGKVSIDSYGVVELDLEPSKLADWAEEQLNSLVQHRMPEGEVTEGEVTWVVEQVEHPLGRMIDLGNDGFESAYRIKDDVIMQVNRSAGPTTRFTISVLEIVRNQQQKYLPRAFTMSFFDAQSGALKTSLGYWNEWQRVGKFDLPTTILEVSSHAGGTSTRQLKLSNYTLAE